MYLSKSPLKATIFPENIATRMPTDLN